jgi:site-specific recombinase XerD
LSEEEVQQLLAAPDLATKCGRRSRLALELLYGSGLRVSEACNVNWGDLELERPSGAAVRVLGKGGRPRLAPLSRAFVDALPKMLGRRRRALRTFLLQTRSGKRMTPDAFHIPPEGIKPDITVTISEADIKAGRDPQLDRAVEIVNQ